MIKRRRTHRRACLLRLALLVLPCADGFIVTQRGPSLYKYTFPNIMQHVAREELAVVEERPIRNRRWQKTFQSFFVRKNRKKGAGFAGSQKKNIPTKVGTSMRMTSEAIAEAPVDMRPRPELKIIQDFEILNPSDVFIDIKHHDKYIDEHAMSVVRRSQEEPKDTAEVEVPSHWLDTHLEKLIHRGATRSSKLKVNVRGAKKMLNSVISGRFKCDLNVSFDELVFAPIQFSRSIVEAKNLTLNIWSFLPTIIPRQAGSSRRRFPNQFDVHFTDLTCSEDDLNQSRCIINGLQRLLNKKLDKMLNSLGINNSIILDTIKLLPSGKVSCFCFAERTPLEIQFRIGFNTRGHVLTFTDFTILYAGYPIPYNLRFDLDVGHNTQFSSIRIEDKKLSLCAKVRITPVHTLKLGKYSQDKESYSATTSFNIGTWLTNLEGFFNH